ncbi:MAG: glycosyltransferase family 4 protein [Candidatus Nanopelagicales bacterium]|nr:glycosyltransferase family 4 protein [Candidatus Nanopelagicales bacterium]
MAKRLLIIQPYVPSYRVPLFRNMKELLSGIGVELAIAAPLASGHDSSRNDDETAIFADFVLEKHQVKIGKKSFFKKDLHNVLNTFDPDMVIVEQAIKNLEAWSLALRPKFRNKPKVAMWGQGRSYSSTQSNVEAAMKQWLTKRMDWFFSYTQSGAQPVIEHGFPQNRVTILNNSTDTFSLQKAISLISAGELESYLQGHGLTRGAVGLFLGGIDERKGVPFLLDAAQEIVKTCPEFKLLVAGDGSLAGEVRGLQERGGPVVYLGRADGNEKAIALCAADLLLIPEWVGLVAVDSLAARVPIVTTEHPSHSPEAEYLTKGKNALFVEHNVRVFADSVTRLLGDRTELERLSGNCEILEYELSIESMANRFVAGIKAWSEIA